MAGLQHRISKVYHLRNKLHTETRATSRGESRWKFVTLSHLVRFLILCASLGGICVVVFLIEIRQRSKDLYRVILTFVGLQYFKALMGLRCLRYLIQR